jgi:hypothetical protein
MGRQGRRLASADNWSEQDLAVTDIYQVWVKEHLDTRWASRFDGFVISYRGDGTTLLVGSVPDQAALHGLLARVRDLGLTLLAVAHLDSEQVNGSPSQHDPSACLA